MFSLIEGYLLVLSTIFLLS